MNGFDYERHAIGDATYQVAVGGDGPAVFLFTAIPRRTTAGRRSHQLWRARTA